ncbi:hypothetical protein ACFE04_029953 [Oxalis oulophora]
MDEAVDHENELENVSGESSIPEDMKVSVVLNLFPNGFCLGINANEKLNSIPEQLLPYDRQANQTFDDIEHGLLPVDFDGLPCKYVNGTILCEIQDYRNCLVQKADTTSLEPSPVVYKVLLRLTMKNVVKDISSMSDVSWSYENRLEAESRILMALQPDLNLDPKRPLNQEQSSKKLNLGITWGTKRRKLIDPPQTQQFCKSQQATPVIVITDNQQSELQDSSVDQAKGRPSSQEKIPNCISSLNENNNVLQTSSQPTSSAIQPSCRVNGDTGKYVTQGPVGPIHREPKKEPILSRRQVENNLKVEVLKKNNLLHQPNEQLKSAPERSFAKEGPSPSTNYTHLAKPEGIIKQGMPRSSMKQVPAKRNAPISTYKRKHQLSSLFQERPPPPSANLNPVGENSKDKAVTQKKKQGRSPQVVAGVTGSTNTSQHVPKEVSVSGQIKDISQFKESILKPVTSNLTATNSNNLAMVNPREVSVSGQSKDISQSKESILKPVTSNLTVTNSNNLAMVNPMSSEVKNELRRLSKIEEVAARYRLHEKKCKVDCKYPNTKFPRPPLLDSNFFSLTEHGSLNNTTTEKTSLSQCFIDRSLNVLKMRVITFVWPSYAQKGNGSLMFNSVGNVKMVMTENLADGTVEARVLYENEQEPEIDGVTLQKTFPGRNSGDLFVAQFSSLMLRDGFYITSDCLKILPRNSGGDSNLGSLFGSANDTLEAGTSQLPSSNIYHPPSQSMPNPVTGSMVGPNNGQLPSHSRFFQNNHFPPQNGQPIYQLADNLTNSSFASIPGCASVQSEWQHILNKRAHMQFQVMQRLKQQEEFMKRKPMLNQPADGGIPGLQNFGFGYRNFPFQGHPLNVPKIEQFPWNGNTSQFNDFGSRIQDNQFSGIIPDSQNAVLSRLSSVQSPGISFASERNSGIGPSRSSPSIPDMAYLLANQYPTTQQVNRSFMTIPELMRRGSTSQQIIYSSAMVIPGSSELSSKTDGGNSCDTSS